MTNVFFLVFGSLVVIAAVGGYYLGRYQGALIDKIRTLESQPKDLPPEPEKPVVTGGAYQPAKQVSSADNQGVGAGLIETKTPEQLAWENDNHLSDLEHS